jgi:gentisate 1,2-dioxygenase
MSADAAALAAFSQRISPLDLSPLWERKARLVPGSDCVPAFWPYADMRPLLAESAELITKKQAERRVLVMENPSLRGTSFVTNALYAGLQIIQPGEVAPSHRHTPSALRFVVEGEGAYTAVSGERIPMHPGDFIVTPNWSWHDHGNLGTGAVVWMDGLDTPFTKMFGAGFREDHAADKQNMFRQEGDNFATYGSNMLPVDYVPTGMQSPVLHYPYARTRPALMQLSGSGDPHPVHGHKLRYANPANGRHPFSTMAVFMQLLPKGFQGVPYRTTEGTVFNVVEGEVTLTAGERTFQLGPRDTAVVPSWTTYRLAAGPQSIVFSYSDRAGQEALGFWREERLG